MFCAVSVTSLTFNGLVVTRSILSRRLFSIYNRTDNTSKEGRNSPKADKSGRIRDCVTTNSSRLDPPDDEPPSLKKDSMEENSYHPGIMSPTAESSVDDHAYYIAQQSLQVSTIQEHRVRPSEYPNQYVSPESFSQRVDEFVDNQATPVVPPHYFQATSPSHEADNYFDGTPRSLEVDGYCEDEEPLAPNEKEFSGTMHSFTYATDNQYDQEYFGAEEKKLGMDKEDVDSQLESSVELINGDGERQGNRFVDTEFVYTGSHNAAPFSPGEISTNTGYDSQSHQSPAMRGAHEILKKRRRRFEL
jgi:hypothetical protein